MAATKQQEKEPVNIVHQNAILVETITKEQRHQKLNTVYGVNPYMKNLNVITGKPNSPSEAGDEAEDSDFLKVYRKAKGPPQDRFPFPQTEAQEIGWDSKPLIQPLREDIRLHRPRHNSEITTYMDAYWRQKEQENLQ